MGERYKYSVTKMAVVTLTRIWVNEIRIEENFRRNEGNNGNSTHLHAKFSGFARRDFGGNNKANTDLVTVLLFVHNVGVLGGGPAGPARHAD